MTVKLLTEHHLEFLSLKGGCTISSEPEHVKMPHCLKSHFAAHIVIYVVAPIVRVERRELFMLFPCLIVMMFLASFLVLQFVEERERERDGCFPLVV